MPFTLTPQTFVAKWRKVTLKESAATKEHFLDLCGLVGHPTPAAADAEGTHFTFEYGAAKLGGGQGFADVFKRGFFGWEYKGKHANLDKAYLQLLQYRAALHNPPLLVVSDIETIVIHPNFVNRANTPTTLTLDDLLTPAGLERLRAIFYHPALLAVDELTGLIMAVGYVRPSKSLADVEVRSVRKKWKDKAFTAAISRQEIEHYTAELGEPLDEHIQTVLSALQGIAADLGLG